MGSFFSLVYWITLKFVVEPKKNPSSCIPKLIHHIGT